MPKWFTHLDGEPYTRREFVGFLLTVAAGTGVMLFIGALVWLTSGRPALW